VVELSVRRFRVSGVFASAPALDHLTRSLPDGVRSGRVAPDELMLVAEGSAEGIEAARDVLGEDPSALVLDVTDGWAGWSLSGADCVPVFASLSELVLPEEGFLQGLVADVPAKVFVRTGGIDILAPAMWAAHVRTRLLEEGHPFAIRETHDEDGATH
jgi:hypothetical protein